MVVLFITLMSMHCFMGIDHALDRRIMCLVWGICFTFDALYLLVLHKDTLYFFGFYGSYLIVSISK